MKKIMPKYFTNIEAYDKIVKNHYKDYSEMILDYDSYANGKTFFEVDDETKDMLYAIQNAMDQNAMVIITFSQITIESFCNAYLIQNIPRKQLQLMTFESKLQKTIRELMSTSGKSLTKKEAKDLYGVGLSELLLHRNKVVHRYPVIVNFNMTSVAKMQKTAIQGAMEIKRQGLRRIDRNIVKNIAYAYSAFIQNLSDAGCTFDNLPFSYKV